MIFNAHGNLAGTHAFLGASNYHWVNYDEDKLTATFFAAMAARRGTELHAYAQQAIKLKVGQADNGSSLSKYINDGIAYRMTPEQILYYSDNCYGQADTASFRNNFLRIHDLKTGITEASFTQLKIYAGLFCLEYAFKPFNIGMELRIYQNDEVSTLNPDPDEIYHIMEKIHTFSRMIDKFRKEAV
jgi:hypothetical protein